MGKQLCRPTQLYFLYYVSSLCRRLISLFCSSFVTDKRDLQVLTLILVICTTAIHLYLLTRKFHMTFHQAISTSQGIGSAIAFSISIIVVWPVMALLAYHLRVS